jgi:iron complex transport system substrate-binding protein
MSLAALLLAGWAGLSPAEPFRVTDSTGRAMTLPAPPRRIVSLVPSVSETLFAIGAHDVLVGVTDFCDYPPGARLKPSVGGMLAPNLETIAGLRPDLVVATTGGNRQETVDQLSRMGIAIYLVNPTTLDDVMLMLGRLAELTGRTEAGGALTAALRSRVDGVAARVAALRPPRVLYVLWADPLIVPGRGALVSELIRLAGGDSISAGLPQDYPRYSIEAAVVRAPEVILLARHGAVQGPHSRELRGQGAAEPPVSRAMWERLSTLPAVRAGRLHAVDGDLVHRYGPRVVEGLELLARLIHPDAFVSGQAATAARATRP